MELLGNSCFYLVVSILILLNCWRILRKYGGYNKLDKNMKYRFGQWVSMSIIGVLAAFLLSL
jgi:hypothetical protein